MRIRVQPAEIEVTDDPKGNPFLEDRLERKDSIVALTTLLGNINGPCVMAVDAGWGMGKTSFRRMWAQYLRNKEFPVVDFNAWETDFTWDAFFALWSEISVQLPTEGGDDASPTRLPTLARELVPLLRGGTTLAAMGLSVAGEADLAAAAAGISGTTGELQRIASEPDADSASEDAPPFLEATYLEAKELLREFHLTLEQAAKSLAEANDGRPLVVTIDELDRCRPTYAIELLETAKHLFSVDHVVFVLFLDRQQLGHSVRAIYGADFNSDGYLRRFFDVDFRLPEPNSTDFLTALGKDLEIPSLLRDLTNNNQLYSPIGDPAALESATNIIEASPLSLRDMQQALARLRILLASLPGGQRLHLDTLVVLLVLRTMDPELYRKVRAGTAKDEEVIAACQLQSQNTGHAQNTVRTTIESVLSAAVCLASCDGSDQLNEEMVPQLLRYRRIAMAAENSPSQRSHEEMIAGLIVRYASSFCGHRSLDQEWDFKYVRDTFGFYAAIRHLELFPD